MFVLFKHKGSAEASCLVPASLRRKVAGEMGMGIPVGLTGHGKAVICSRSAGEDGYLPFIYSQNPKNRKCAAQPSPRIIGSMNRLRQTDSMKNNAEHDIGKIARRTRTTVVAGSNCAGRCLSPNFEPGPTDVICSRGKEALVHVSLPYDKPYLFSRRTCPSLKAFLSP